MVLAVLGLGWTVLMAETDAVAEAVAEAAGHGWESGAPDLVLSHSPCH